MVLNAFKSGIFPLQPTQDTGNLGTLPRVAEDCYRSHLKILSLELLHRLQAGKTSDNLRKEIYQLICFVLSKRNY